MTPLVLIAVFLYGIPIALAVDARLRGAALAGTSFLLGIGTIALHMFTLSVLRIPWTRTSVLLALAPLFILTTILAKRRAWLQPAHSREGRAGAMPYVVDLIVLVALVAYAIFALCRPPYEWDFYGIWGLKAKWFFEAGGVDWTFLRTNTSHPDYPLLVPLMFDFLAVVTGGWNDAAFGWLYIAIGASLIAIVRGHAPALVTLAAAFPALSVWIGHAEGAVMAYGCAGLLFLRAGSIRTGAIFLGLAAWSKNEGLAWIVTAALALLIATRGIRKVLALWPAVALISPWLIARSVLKLPTDLAQGSALQRILEHLRDPVTTFNALWSATPDQPYFWLVVALIVVLYARRAVQREQFLLLALLLQSAALVVPLLATPFDLGGHASFALNRIPHQLAPAAAFLAAMLLTRDLSAPSPSGESLPPPRPSTD